MSETRPPAPEHVSVSLEGPPSGYFVIAPSAVEADGITLGEVLRIGFRAWKTILICGLAGGVLAGAASYLVRPTYRAATIISPIEQTTGAGALRSQFGGLAALAGIDLGSGGRDKEQALATLKSTGFAREFILSENLMPVLYADRWDAKTKTWKAGEPAPSLELAVTRFARSICQVTEVARTGIITLTVEWYSPEDAAIWANRLVERVNERMRVEARRNADRSIEFLNQELAKTSVIELRHAIYRLIEEQVNNAMLANVQREYAFRVIDAAVAPEIRAKPKRTMMVLIGAVVGGFLGLIGVFIRRSFRSAPPAKS
jgi:uncharacterized protein involved in exopolysaccharide biosynthesis